MYTPYHYFFYGLCTENVLAGMIASAESKGCEFVQLIPQMAPVAPAGLVRASGKPEMVIVYRILVRCKKEDFPRIAEEMQAEAKKEQAEGLRGNIVQ